MTFAASPRTGRIAASAVGMGAGGDGGNVRLITGRFQVRVLGPTNINIRRRNSMSEKKPFYKRWWFWVIVAIVIAVIGGGEINQERKSRQQL